MRSSADAILIDDAVRSRPGARLFAQPVSLHGRQFATVVAGLSLAPWRQTEEIAVVVLARSRCADE
ncbi:hypothetical protein FDG2_2834 [Candidatus Protofrankia californiensis]|uniref:Uncharacterized protein n=1 Tax=Candidatus Protofrankia californiensis TaxID=1839754 RepID=A0A1C3NYC4_9ACTN|nr:hypothetical protein FDG2_2834 [Candidatus Protofrankia californiensis]